VLNQHAPISKSDDGMDIALCSIDYDRKVLVFAGAAADLYHASGEEVVRIKGDRQSLGYRSSPINHRYTNHTVNLDRDSAFYLFTDGLIHQNGGDKGLPFGPGRVIRFIKESIGRTFEEQQTLLEQLFMEYKGSQPQLDDITVLGFSAQGTMDSGTRY